MPWQPLLGNEGAAPDGGKDTHLPVAYGKLALPRSLRRLAMRADGLLSVENLFGLHRLFKRRLNPFRKPALFGAAEYPKMRVACLRAIEAVNQALICWQRRYHWIGHFQASRRFFPWPLSHRLH